MRCEMKKTQASIESLAIMRWRRGHQVFHALLVTLNSVAEESLVAIKKGDTQSLTNNVRYLSVLFNASTATMKYATDFPAEIYEETIRPSMMPPNVKSGLSGSLNKEHTVMRKLLLELKESLKNKYGSDHKLWPDELAKAWQELEHAKKLNRENHGLVCAKFVDDGVSLLAQHYRDRKNHV